MQIIVKLYCSSLDSLCASFPIAINNKHQYELTLKDLKMQLES